MQKSAKIYVAGHRGMVGSALTRKLESEGYTNLVTRTIDELNLLDQAAVSDFFKKESPAYVFLAAAKVGGIMANNTFRAQFIYENLQIQNNIIHQSHLHGVRKLLFLGSSCIYPKMAPQPMKEEHLLTGPLEYTNEPYAIAKIAGIKMCQAYRAQYGSNFISIMPTNLYGPNDNFNLQTSHVFPALIRKMHLGKCLQERDIDSLRLDLAKRPVDGINGNSPEKDIREVLKKFGIAAEDDNSSIFTVTLWGTGAPKREFLHVDDLASAAVFLMNTYDSGDFVNIGVGEDLTIRELAEMIKTIVGFNGNLKFDDTKPDGTPRKLLDVSRLHSLGWKAGIELQEGIHRTYEWYLES